MVAAERQLVFTNRVMEDQVFMLLDKGIGPSDDPNVSYIDGTRFAEELYYWKAQGKKVVVKINSPGGRVTHGWSMIDAIIETGAETENVGIAYSMGGICLLFGSKRRAYDFSSCMIHAPHGPSGNENYLKVVRAQFKSLLETRTKFSAEEIEDMMTSGKDYFFNAQEMLAKGIIDEIVTSKKLKVPASASVVELHQFFNSALHESQPKMKMENLFAKFFKKSNDEEAIIAAMEMKAENDSLKTQNASITAEITALKAEVAALKEATQKNEANTKATELIAGAQTAGKLANITPEQKAKMIEMAVADFDSVKLMLDATPAKAPGKTKAAVAVIDAAAKTSVDKTYEWLAKNDPDKLQDIAENDPDLFSKLQDEYVARMKGETE